MKTTAVLFSSVLLAVTLSAHGGNEDKSNNHMGDHMHNGKMMNHANPNGMTDKEMKSRKDTHHMN